RAALLLSTLLKSPSISSGRTGGFECAPGPSSLLRRGLHPRREDRLGFARWRRRLGALLLRLGLHGRGALLPLLAAEHLIDPPLVDAPGRFHGARVARRHAAVHALAAKIVGRRERQA